MVAGEEPMGTRISSKERIQKVLLILILIDRSVDQTLSQRPASSVGRALDS